MKIHFTTKLTERIGELLYRSYAACGLKDRQRGAKFSTNVNDVTCSKCLNSLKRNTINPYWENK